MPFSKKLKAFLDEKQIRYLTLHHSPAYTAQELAAASHIAGHLWAKTVIVSADGRMAMAVLPATERLDLDALGRLFGAKVVRLADEKEFRGRFPDCELGAMPPFGNLFNMQVVVSPTLAEDEKICFNAGSHQVAFKMAFADFARLVEPVVAPFTRPVVG
ncbi:MAG: deacylase [Nitrospirae bacterium CG18_big_fil_WC_8_21_14_2_50_70_55]|nr:YbaK/EbsC family protein [Deltaproteobacteria bacterium]OIP65956.1 MAG: deacylase [Nitrospirae bacterium CG2_30_70_394]PIQ06766.1 MAG: deacylase [Nitrospirae bacterium CG18_big_fil_WC_8_21_14_2_50_70_55]PIU80015.1 MAG: deacylase [Nitrospirae bacterium CG06_land_8_20_14_3_00_70_43]PIW83267.1 MAG: deacylase [Nitrospirae bacterium CG_4_8_14_3_um_filter_70_85]PIX82580.1 MAG: deacylase [Nitrospirae bacterium CG_4_10_14_3_um_filter_70_108]PJB94890.1 MAG: deacylase [Nitrospirae bacterium CG_4_9_1